MIVAGIDIGGKVAKALVMKDGEILGQAAMLTGIKKAEAAERVYGEALKDAGLRRENVERVVATGSGAGRVEFADGRIADAAADARGVNHLVPSVRTIIDVGAEEGRAIKCSADGRVLDFAVNEKCAAGTGTFVDTMARTLEMKIEEIGELSLRSTQSIPMNAQCAVFGESEVVSLIHARTPKADIARAVHDAIAGRIGSVARIVGLEDDIALVGGVARNIGFVESLKRELGHEIKVVNEPDFVGALGCALAAAAGVLEERVEAKEVKREIFEGGK